MVRDSRRRAGTGIRSSRNHRYAVCGCTPGVRADSEDIGRIRDRERGCARDRGTHLQGNRGGVDARDWADIDEWVATIRAESDDDVGVVLLMNTPEAGHLRTVCSARIHPAE